MNGQEQATLNGIAKELKAHIVVSNERHITNTKILSEIRPILKAAHDKKITDKFVEKTSASLVGLLKFVALIIGIIISIRLFLESR